MRYQRELDIELKKQYCEAIIARHPDSIASVEAYNNLAVLYDKQGDYIHALKNYALAVNLQPEYVAAHYNLGLLFLKQQDWDKALIQFNNVIALDASRWSAHYYVASLYLQQEKLDLAKEHYLEVLSIQPENSDTLCNLGVICLKEDEPQWAIDYFTRALAFDNHHQDAKNNLAATFMQYDRYENAARHYLELLSEYPNNEEYHYNIAVAYMNLGHLDEAITHFQSVLKKESSNSLTKNTHTVASYNNLAAIYWRLNEKEQAKYYLRKALSLDPANKISQYLLTAAASPQEKNNEDENSLTCTFTASPQEYIQNLFDNYAVQYDEHLCQQLQYQIPAKIHELLKSQQMHLNHLDSLNIVSEHWKSLDLGCGTGLMGPILKPYSSVLWGVDLSQKMLDNAQRKGLYDQLICEDIIHYLNNTQDQFDCITAIEVFEYFGDLTVLFQVITQHLKPNGIFIFSIELMNALINHHNGQEKTFKLQETARFAHHSDYIQHFIQEHHFSIIHQIPMVGRLQDNKPLDSCLYFLKANLKTAYKAMTDDEEREKEANAWVEGVIGNIADVAP